MAPLPENNTGRYFVDYAFRNQGRSLQLRYGVGTAVESLPFHAGVFLSALAPLMDDSWVIQGARIQSAGSPFSVPTVPPTLSVGPSGGTIAPANYPQFTTFVGRGTISGRRVRVFVYGLILGNDGSYRISAPTGALAAARNALIAALGEDNVGVTIGGDAPTWYNYVNQGFNSYWEREARES